MGDRMRWADWLLLPFLVLGMGAIGYLAFRWLGFLGIGIIGLLTGLVAVNVELEGGRPIGLTRSNIYSTSFRAEERMSRAEKAAWHAERTSYGLPLFIAKVASAGMIILGFGLFFMFQLPG